MSLEFGGELGWRQVSGQCVVHLAKHKLAGQRWWECETLRVHQISILMLPLVCQRPTSAPKNPGNKVRGRIDQAMIVVEIDLSLRLRPDFRLFPGNAAKKLFASAGMRAFSE